MEPLGLNCLVLLNTKSHVGAGGSSIRIRSCETAWSFWTEVPTPKKTSNQAGKFLPAHRRRGFLSFHAELTACTVGESPMKGEMRTGVSQSYMGGCQHYGPLSGSLNIRCRVIVGIQKGTIILTTCHLQLCGAIEGV